jgi:exopolyphosphatase/guanosine-5'-triphosphate,3'-diphosphate pyrophosphatase
MKPIIALFFAILSTFSCVTPDAQTSSCIETRAAFDIGSGGTRMKVGKVDLCQHKVLEMYATVEEKVGYKDDLSANQTGAFSEAIKTKGLAVLADMKAKAAPFKPKKFIAGATSAFREASNGPAFAQQITQTLGIETRVLTQREEGILGFLGAVATAKAAKENILVWDIGGGSKQLTALAADKKNFEVFSDGYASVAFKNAVIQQVKHANPAEVVTPNPVGAGNLEAAANLVYKSEAKIPEFFKTLIKNPTTKVIGIGDVHYYSVRGQTGVNGNTFTKDDIKRTINQRISWNDKKIGGNYAETDVTNLILVHSYMDALGIKKVETTKVNMTDSILIWNLAAI